MGAMIYEKEDMLAQLNVEIDEKMRLLSEKESQRQDVIARVNTDLAKSKSKVSLNVGGRIFTASEDTFLRWEDTYFHAMLSCNAWQPDEDGTYFVDRDPDYFGHIMTALRSGCPVDTSGLSVEQIQQLRIEQDYFQLPPWAKIQPAIWDIGHCSSNLKITNDGHTVMGAGNVLFCGAVLGAKVNTDFKIRVESGHVMVGYATRAAFQPDNCEWSMGWFLDCSYGSIFDKSSCAFAAYCPSLEEGGTIGVQLDTKTSSVSFVVNGTNRGVAFRNVGTEPLFPCVGFYLLGGSVTLEE